MEKIDIENKDSAVIDNSIDKDEKPKRSVVELIDSLDDEIFVHYNRFGRIEPKPKEKDELADFVDEMMRERQMQNDADIQADENNNKNDADIQNDNAVAGILKNNNDNGILPYSSDIQNDENDADIHDNYNDADIRNAQNDADIHLNNSSAILKNNNRYGIYPYSSVIRYDENDSVIQQEQAEPNKRILIYNENIPYSSDIQLSPRQADILRRVAELVAEGERERQRRYYTGRVFPQSEFANDITTEEELMERLRGISRKSHRNLERLYDCCCVIGDYMVDGVIAEVCIATTGGLGKRFTRTGASEVIRLAKRVDLLICTDANYRWSRYKDGTQNKDYGKARCYIINPRMVELISRAYLGAVRAEQAEERVRKPEKPVKTDKREDVAEGMPEADIEGVDIRFASNLHLNARITDEQVEQAIRRRYPFFTEMQNIVERVNRDYYAGQSIPAYRLGIKITRGAKGVISKVGTRLHNRLSQLRAHDIPDGYSRMTREQFLELYYKGEEWHEYDVKSSIYRVAYFLRTGEWLNNAVDLYALMSPYPFRGEADRDNYKQGLAMQLYFGGSPQKIVANLYGTHKKRMRKLTQRGVKREELTEAIAVAQRRMFSVVGPSLGSEVMLHESGIYLLVAYGLLKRGLRMLTVYDEFIADDPRMPELVERMLPRVAEFYRAKMQVGRIDVMEKCTKD